MWSNFVSTCMWGIVRVYRYTQSHIFPMFNSLCDVGTVGYLDLPPVHIKIIPSHFMGILLSDWWFGTFILFFHILGISSSQLTFIPRVHEIDEPSWPLAWLSLQKVPISTGPDTWFLWWFNDYRLEIALVSIVIVITITVVFIIIVKGSMTFNGYIYLFGIRYPFNAPFPTFWTGNGYLQRIKTKVLWPRGLEWKELQ